MIQIQDPYLRRLAEVESGMNPLAKNPNSSAGGLFQFIDSTAQQYGLDDRFNPDKAINAATKFTEDNKAYLRKALGREPTPGELYLAHQQGAAGAAKILSNPTAPAADIVGQQAVALNAGGQGVTAGDFANQWIGKFEQGYQAPQPDRSMMLAAADTVNMTDASPDMIPANSIEVEAPDGTIIEFPAGMADADIEKVMAENYPAPKAAEKPRIEQNFLERVSGDAQKRTGQMEKIAERYVGGDRSALEAYSQMALKQAQLATDVGTEVLTSGFRALPNAIENPIRQGASNVYSVVANSPVGDFAGSAIKKYGDFAEKHPRAAGNIEAVADAGNLLAGFIPIKGTSAIDAAADTTTALAKQAGNVIQKAPKVPLSNEVRLLQNSGVRLTSGQRAGGLLKAIEDKSTSIPIVGDAINAARSRGINDFNVSVGNEVLASLGTKVPKNVSVGRDLVNHVYDTIGQSYDNVLPQMTGVIDNDFTTGLSSALSKASLLPASKAKQVSNILDDIINKRAVNGIVDGQQNKEIMRRLTKNANTYGKSLDPDQQLMGEIFSDVKSEYSAMLGRNNAPDLAQKLKDTDLAFAKYVRLEKAAGAVGNEKGVFTPAQLQSAVKSSDNSVRRGAFAKGDALLQDLSEAGKMVLPSKVPDSGTAGRALWALGALGTGGAAAMAAPAIIPGLALGALAAGSYTRPGQYALSALSKTVRK